METGNPKQVAVLCVAAVGAIGFLVTRLGGKAATTVLAAVAGHQEVQKSPGIPSDLPILVDAFSHPRLAPPKSPISPAVLTSTIRPEHTLAGDIDESLPFAGDASGEATIQPASNKTTKPESPKAEMKPEPVDVALEATAGASDPVAFISIAGTDSQPFRPNDQIKGKVRLLRIEDGAVVLSGPKGQLTINVGERKRI